MRSLVLSECAEARNVHSHRETLEGVEQSKEQATADLVSGLEGSIAKMSTEYASSA